MTFSCVRALDTGVSEDTILAYNTTYDMVFAYKTGAADIQFHGPNAGTFPMIVTQNGSTGGNGTTAEFDYWVVHGWLNWSAFGFLGML